MSAIKIVLIVMATGLLPLALILILGSRPLPLNNLNARIGTMPIRALPITTIVGPHTTQLLSAMFIQSALVYAYYLLPFSMIVVCVMIAGRETQNNGILKMLALPVSRYSLSLAKFFVLTFYLLMEMVVFLAVFVVAGLVATSTMGITETLPVFYLLKWCAGLFFTMLPSLAAMWAITVLFEKPLLSVGLNLLLVIPGVLISNMPLWIAYPYCYSGYLVSCSLHDFTAETSDAAFSMMPFLPCAIAVFIVLLALATAQFGKKEMR